MSGFQQVGFVSVSLRIIYSFVNFIVGRKVLYFKLKILRRTMKITKLYVSNLKERCKSTVDRHVSVTRLNSSGSSPDANQYTAKAKIFLGQKCFLIRVRYHLEEFTASFPSRALPSYPRVSCHRAFLACKSSSDLLLLQNERLHLGAPEMTVKSVIFAREKSDLSGAQQCHVPPIRTSRR
jgi:hypothetical protein